MVAFASGIQTRLFLLLALLPASFVVFTLDVDISEALRANRDAIRCTRQLVRLGGWNYLLGDMPSEMANSIGGANLPAWATDSSAESLRVRRWQVLSAILQGNLAAAKYLQQATLDAKPSDAYSLMMSGFIAHLSGRQDESTRYWLRLDESGRAIRSMAHRLVRAGHKEQALVYYKAAGSAHPDSQDAHLSLAEVLYSLSKRDEALEHYQAGFEASDRATDTDLDEAAYHYANILSERGKYQKAIVALEMAIARHPGYPYYLIALGEAYEQLGDFPEAEYWLSEAVRMSPALDSVYYSYGNYYVRRGSVAQAVVQYQRAIAANPGGPAYLYGNLGTAYVQLGERELAAGAFREALRRDPDNTVYRGLLDSVLSTTGGAS